MSKLLSLILSALLLPTLGGSSGYTKAHYAKYYSKGTMERVLAYRIKHHQIGNPFLTADGFASTPDCANIGKYVVVELGRSRNFKYGPIYTLLVVDCSAPKDRGRHLSEHLVVEVDYETAQRAGFIRQGKIEARVHCIQDVLGPCRLN